MKVYVNTVRFVFIYSKTFGNRYSVRFWSADYHRYCLNIVLSMSWNVSLSHAVLHYHFLSMVINLCFGH